VTDRSTAEDPNRAAPLPRARAARRDGIVRAAMRLLMDSDYEDIQMRDVAEQSGVALGTLYRYFASKEQLFAAVQLEWVERLHRRVAEAHELRGSSNLERLLELIHTTIRAFEQRPQFYRVLLVLEGTRDPVARELYDVMHEATNATYLMAITGVDEKEANVLLDASLAILSAEMRAWALGKRPIGEARRKIDEQLRALFTYRDVTEAAGRPSRRLRAAGQ